MPRQTITAVVLTYNNEAIIERFMQSVSWVDEVVVVDSGSSDSTCALAKGAHPQCNVLTRQLDSFAAQRNFGLDQATSDWVFHCDSDDVVPGDLRVEILAILQAGKATFNAYNVIEQLFWRGHRISYCDGPWGAGVKFHRKGMARMQGAIHETASTPHLVGLTRSPIHHMTEDTLDERVLKYLNYSDREVRALLQSKGKRSVTLWDVIWKPSRRLFGQVLIRGAYKDGVPSLAWAALRSFGLFLTELKYWDMVKNKGHSLIDTSED